MGCGSLGVAGVVRAGAAGTVGVVAEPGGVEPLEVRVADN